MARLGIDFGTTNTVVMIEDRGVLSEVRHAAETGAGRIVQEVFPSAILIDKRSGRRWFGIEADRLFGQRGPSDDHVFIPSLKRQLRHYAEGADWAGGDGERFDLADLLRSFLAALAESIRQSCSLADEEPLEAVITWPANANGGQRYITRRCFREAGIDVLDTLNEPTASAIELADCLAVSRGGRSAEKPDCVAVFDLGGGTFDASIVRIENEGYRVLASSGIEDLGGDDFDAALLETFIGAMQLSEDDISPLTRHALLRQARVQKETIAAGAVKSLFMNPMDFGLMGRMASVKVEAFYERVRPMIQSAVDMLKELLEKAVEVDGRIDGEAALTIYLVGGSSKLPIVSEMIAESFPSARVVLTDKPFRSAAMGAAVCATKPVNYRDVFARHFGLLRGWDHGRREAFDTIFPAGTPIPRRGEAELVKVSRYQPRHNIGHLRYLECTAIGSDGLPSAGVRAWSDILFPYDPALAGSLDGCEIVESDVAASTVVEEVYRCDSDGVITVELHHPGAHSVPTFEVFRD